MKGAIVLLVLAAAVVSAAPVHHVRKGLLPLNFADLAKAAIAEHKALGHAMEDVNWNSCGVPEDRAKINNITATPAIAPGVESILAFNGESTVDVKDGEAQLQVFLLVGGILPVSVLDEKVPICAEGEDCPWKVGEISINSPVELPAETPAGTYLINYDAKDGFADPLFCVSVSFTI